MLRWLIPVLAFVSAEVSAREPVIDMHLHANNPAMQGPPPQAMCTPIAVMPPWDTRGDWPSVFANLSKNPPCPDPIWSPTTEEEYQRRTFAELEKYNVFAALSGDGDRPTKWKAANPGRIIALDASPNRLLTDSAAASPQLKAALEAAKSKGERAVIGELGAQYFGIAPNDPRLEPIWQAATEYDVPVGLHVGPGPPGTAYFPGLGKYRAAHSSPLLLEDVLLKHPKLRLYLMHAGYPLIDDTLALMYAHPQVYVDVGVIIYVLQRPAFYRYLQTLVDAGFGKRIMFGSDQMIWPEAIGRSIKVIEDAPFLSKDQKRDILYNNAARFLRLDDATIKRHHAM